METGVRSEEIISSLAGPTTNVMIGYLAFLAFRLAYKPRIRQLFGYAGFSNLFIAFFAAIVNLIADTLSGNPANDLQLVSHLLGLNPMVLPGVFVLLCIPPLWYLSSEPHLWLSRRSSVSIAVVAWFAGGGTLMLLDAFFNLRFQIV